jgi:flagella synthesis protein FlgN
MLSAQLNQQLESIQSLHQTLEEETACLKEKNFSQLNTILFKKQQLLQAISKLDKVLSAADIQNEITHNEDFMTLKNEIEEQLAACQKLTLSTDAWLN